MRKSGEQRREVATELRSVVFSLAMSSGGRGGVWMEGSRSGGVNSSFFTTVSTEDEKLYLGAPSVSAVMASARVAGAGFGSPSLATSSVVFLVFKTSDEDLRVLELEEVALVERADDVERVDGTLVFRRLEEMLVLAPINLVGGKEDG